MIRTDVRTRMQDLFDAPIKKQFVNRTGATRNKGDIVAVDLTGSATEAETYTAFDPSTDADTAHPFSNVISVATAHLAGWVFAVCDDDSVADDAVGTFTLRGVIDVEFPAAGTDDIDAGDQITATNAQTYASLGNDAQVCLGIALEDAGGAVALKKAVFDGYAMGATGAASLS